MAGKPWAGLAGLCVAGMFLTGCQHCASCGGKSVASATPGAPKATAGGVPASAWNNQPASQNNRWPTTAGSPTATQGVQPVSYNEPAGTSRFATGTNNPATNNVIADTNRGSTLGSASGNTPSPPSPPMMNDVPATRTTSQFQLPPAGPQETSRIGSIPLSPSSAGPMDPPPPEPVNVQSGPVSRQEMVVPPAGRPETVYNTAAPQFAVPTMPNMNPPPAALPNTGPK